MALVDGELPEIKYPTVLRKYWAGAGVIAA